MSKQYFNRWEIDKIIKFKINVVYENEVADILFWISTPYSRSGYAEDDWILVQFFPIREKNNDNSNYDLINNGFNQLDSNVEWSIESSR